MNRTEMTDEQLAAAAQSDSAAFDELAVRYLPTVAARAAGFSGDGCSLGSEDLGQEGFIGLMGAVRSYDPSLSVPFRAYAIMCIDRRIHSAVRHTYCKGQVPDALKVAPDSWEDIGEGSISPEQLVLSKEAYGSLMGRIDAVASERERQVLRLFLSGRSYRDIAARLHCSTKSVGNALQRLRRKLQAD
jgi:RNA polymerase sporulation-specific sigma factor